MSTEIVGYLCGGKVLKHVNGPTVKIDGIIMQSDEPLPPRSAPYGRDQMRAEFWKALLDYMKYRHMVCEEPEAHD